MLSIARAPCRTEQKGCSAKARHAVLRDQQHLSVSCPLHDRSHSFVERAVDPLDRIAEGCCHRRDVRRMRFVVDVPALVADEMTLEKHLNEEVPVVPVEQLERHRRLRLDPTLEPGDVQLGLLDRAQRPVHLVHRIGSKPPDDLVRKAWRRGLECQVTFTAPFHDLDPVQARV
jgi:hypothetical protein